MKITIVMPTYNEAQNIGRMIDQLLPVFDGISHHQMSLLVVDDNSPDGTQDIVRAKMAVHGAIDLITGTKEGLGKAYVRGMDHAIRSGADALFEMDSDFSHDPKDVPRMIAALEQGFDFVIGSRYVPGGTIPEEWGTVRKLNSWGGNLVARHIAGMSEIRDCTAGFRCIRTNLLRRIDLSTIKTQGYGFQVSLLHAAKVNGARITEIPVHFVDRTAGTSKLGLRDIVEFIFNAAAIRMTSLQTFLRFCLVGASGVIANLSLLSLLLAAGVDKFIASPLAIEGSIIWNFFLNYRWTFAERQTKTRVRTKGLQFNVVSILSLSVSYGCFLLLSKYTDASPYLAQVAGIIPATAVNYFLNSYWTFADERGLRSAPTSEGISTATADETAENSKICLVEP